MKVNTHGRTIHGLKRASGMTYNERRWSEWHHRVFYDRETGSIWTENIFGKNTYIVYENNPDIITVIDTREHLTMQAIADELDWVLSLREHYDADC